MEDFPSIIPSLVQNCSTYVQTKVEETRFCCGWRWCVNGWMGLCQVLQKFGVQYNVENFRGSICRLFVVVGG